MQNGFRHWNFTGDSLVEVLPAANSIRQHTRVAETKNVPLAVDLDGTLIRTDLMWESLARVLRRNPFAIFKILFWWSRGRAFMKKKLGERVQIDPATLPCNEKFLAWLREEKTTGRKIILATASDLKLAQPVADHFGIFDEVLASEGEINLRSENKLRALTEKLGERGFDYAGNSSADFAVWRGSREAVVVNASSRVLREAANCTTLGPTFCENFSPLAVARSVCTELFWRSGYLVSIIAGLLLAAAFPKWNIAGFAWIVPALMVFAANGKNFEDAARAGFVAGFTFWLASLYWLLLIPVTGFPILGWLALSAYLAAFFSVWVAIVSHFQFTNSSWAARARWALGGAAAWVAIEMLRLRLFGGMPWIPLGVSQFKLVPLIQIATVTGVYGVSFLVVWLSLALFSAVQMIFRNPTRRHVWQAEIFFPLVVTLLCFAGGTFWLKTFVENPAGKNSSTRITIIQPNIPQTLIWDSGADEIRFHNLVEFSESAVTNKTSLRPEASARQADLLLWPESAVPVMNEENCRVISDFARRHHVWMILNGDDVEVLPDATNYFNAAFLINPDGVLTRAYHKRNLVIFGEYIPLVRWLPFLKWFTPITGGFASGGKSVTFPLDDLHAKTAPLICFEDAFPNLARDAAQDDLDFLVNVTNDGWFGEGAEQWQHFAMSIFRTVETGVPLVRCANNGISGWIDAQGRVQEIFRDAHGSEYGSGALTIDIPLNPTLKSSPTFYRQHGDWFGWGCVGVTLLLLLTRFRKKTAQ